MTVKAVSKLVGWATVLSATMALEPAFASPACSALQGLLLAPSQTPAATGGAVVDRAVLAGSDCTVDGRIFAVTHAPTPPIRFRLNLPAHWNGVAVHFGGGGLNGQVVTADGDVPFAPWRMSPLRRGFATFGSDSGHSGNSEDGSFALIPDALANFAGLHIKRTRDVAVRIIDSYYGRPPSHVYFVGASTGGREALTAVQHYPEDYDGAIASAPAANFVAMRMMGLLIGQRQYRSSGRLTAAELQTVRDSVLALCDTSDGLADEIVGDVAGCRSRRRAILQRLRKTLSAAQIRTVNYIASGVRLSFRPLDGARIYPGYRLLDGTDMRESLGKSEFVEHPPSASKNGKMFSKGDVFLRYFVRALPDLSAADPSYYDLSQWKARLTTLSTLIDATTSDTAAFQRRGGKLILMQGLNDDVVSPDATIAWFERQLSRYGAARIATFLRFYTVPGFGHGSGVFVPEWDALGMLDQWVRGGVPPNEAITTDRNPLTAGRSRPLCRFPGFPRYRGAGDTRSAENYYCSISGRDHRKYIWN